MLIDRKTFFPLLLIIGVIQVITMPRFFYPGDNYVARAECAYLLTTGKFGIDFKHRDSLAGFVENRGQYFFENVHRQKFFSKYGVGCTLLYVPPLLAEFLYTGKLELIQNSNSLIVFMNVYNICLAVLMAGYLYGIAGLYCNRGLVKIIFVLLSVYTTYLWHYLRAPTYEILQAVPFVGFYYHLVKFMRLYTESRANGSKTWLHLAVSTVYVSILVMLKSFYILLLGIIVIFAFIAGERSVPLFQRIYTNIFRNWKRYFVYLMIPTALLLACILFLNWYKFGSPFELGYSQHKTPNGLSNDRFSSKFFYDAFYGFFLKPGNANIFVHYPIIILSVFGMRRFLKKYPLDFGLCVSVFAVIVVPICHFSVWVGEWCYGPRLVLWALVAISIPFIETLQMMVEKGLKVLNVVFCIGAVCLLGWSFDMQINVNSLHYFVWYYVEGAFKQLHDERIDCYFGNVAHRGKIYGDVLSHARGKKEFLPIRIAKSRLWQNKTALNYLEAFMRQQTRLNYLLFSN